MWEAQKANSAVTRMIVMYHKIDIITPSRWWVSVDRFKEQITELADKVQCVYLDQYDPCSARQAVITFDDAYENVYRHAFPILRKRRIPFEVFVISDVLSDWNDFDGSEMRTRFCSQEQLQEMGEAGARIQWHSRTHKLLTKLYEKELETELTVRDDLRVVFPEPHLRWFAYPYGAHNERVVAEARLRFVGALSVTDGVPGDRHQMNRVTADQLWRP